MSIKVFSIYIYIYVHTAHFCLWYNTFAIAGDFMHINLSSKAGLRWCSTLYGHNICDITLMFLDILKSRFRFSTYLHVKARQNRFSTEEVWACWRPSFVKQRPSLDFLLLTFIFSPTHLVRVCVCVRTSNRQVSSAVGFAQVVLSEAGVFPFICSADVMDPQDSIWSYCHPEKTANSWLTTVLLPAQCMQGGWTN